VLIASGTDPRLCPSRGDCVRKQIVWMLRPLREPCSVERHALATFEVEQVVTYHELTRLYQQLTGEVVRYKNEIHALLVVLFPEFTQVFADPSRPSALTVLKAYPSAQAMQEAEPKLLYQILREQCPGRD
jgi:hypothetical protein